MSTTTFDPPLAAAEKQIAAIAATSMTTVLNAAPGSEPAWAKPAVAVLSLVLFAGMIAIAYLTHDETMKTLLGGSVIGMASTSISYYLGSSSGSAQKTNLLAAAPPVPGLPTH